MGLITSGIISIGGTTVGRSINLELGKSATSFSTLNDSDFRDLAGKSSGLITLGNFYGKTFSTTPITTVGVYYTGGIWGGKTQRPSNTVTRINSSGALVGSQTAVGTAQNGISGAAASGIGIYYASGNITRINSSGTQVGAETTWGHFRIKSAGVGMDTLGLFYGGLFYGGNNYSVNDPRNEVTRINSSGAMVGSETAVGTKRGYLAGANINNVSVFYGGFITLCINTVTRINSSGALVGSQTAVGSSRTVGGGACVDDITGLFYIGHNASSYLNKLTRINSSGTQIGSEVNIGTARSAGGGATVNGVGVFYAGMSWGNNAQTNYNTVTRINSAGSQIGSQTAVGTARNNLAGAGL